MIPLKQSLGEGTPRFPEEQKFQELGLVQGVVSFGENGQSKACAFQTETEIINKSSVVAKFWDEANEDGSSDVEQEK